MNTSNITSKLLAETFTTTAFFRSLIDYPYSEEILEYLLNESGLTKEELQARWDWFDKVFWEEYWKKISALSFSTIIEARWLLLDSILKSEVDENTIVLEVASWFSPRAINLINNHWFKASQYIETDKAENISLKQGFYNWLANQEKPVLSDFNVVTDDISKLEKLILNLKELNPNINKLVVLNEWLLIYLTPEEQWNYFNNLKELKLRLTKHWINIKYITIDMPTHENFTDWLLHEWFTHDDHVNVMKNVDSKILECLHMKESDFLDNIWVKKIKKYYYPEEIISSLNTWKLIKYREVPEIEKKIKNFLEQKILFAYSVEI